jgi:hypothetical protein
MCDQKINTIYEGTNGIQAMDLLDRKPAMMKGTYFMNLISEVKDSLAQAKTLNILKEEVLIVGTALDALSKAAMDFVGLMKTNPYVPLIAASDFLNCFGDTLLGWYHI